MPMTPEDKSQISAITEETVEDKERFKGLDEIQEGRKSNLLDYELLAYKSESAEFSSQINRLSQGSPRYSLQGDFRSVKSSISGDDEDVPREECNKRKSTKVSRDRVIDD